MEYMIIALQSFCERGVFFMIENISPRVERLKKRATHCCCRYCGGELDVRQIVFHTQASARIELYCDQCKKIEYGVEKDIYEAARSFVNATEFNHFQDIEDNEKRLQMNIAKICSVTTWQLRYLGFLSDNGFTVPVNKSGYEVDQCTTIEQSDLMVLLKEANQWSSRLLKQEG